MFAQAAGPSGGRCGCGMCYIFKCQNQQQRAEGRIAVTLTLRDCPAKMNSPTLAASRLSHCSTQTPQKPGVPAQVFRVQCLAGHVHIWRATAAARRPRSQVFLHRGLRINQDLTWHVLGLLYAGKLCQHV